MNKVLKATVALCCMVMTISFIACSQVDNPSIPSAGSAVITVNVSALYEELDIIDEITHELSLDDTNINGTVFIYDANGQLVKQLSGETRQLVPLTINAKSIPNGTYTIVAIQHLAHKASSPWQVVNPDQLSTVRVEQSDAYSPEAQNALGIVYETVTVKGGNIEAEVTPRAAGSVIDFRADGITESKGIDSLAMYVKPLTAGLYLNTELSEADRGYSNDDSKYLRFFITNTDETPLYRRYFCLNKSKNKVFILTANYPKGQFEVTRYTPDLSSEKAQLIYYDFNDWNMNWQYCGPKEGFDKWMAEKQQAPLLLKPCTDWGCSLADVINHVNAAYYWYANDTNGNLYQWDNYWLEELWIGVKLWAYYCFETQDGQNLQKVIFENYVDDLPIELFTNNLESQGYVFLSVEDIDGGIVYTYQSTDQKTMLEAYGYKDGWEIIYYPTPPAGARSNVPYINPKHNKPGILWRTQVRQ